MRGKRGNHRRNRFRHDRRGLHSPDYQRGRPPEEGDAGLYAEAIRVAEQLCEDSDYLIDREAHTVSLTKCGKLKAHTDMAAKSQGGLQRSWGLYVEQALQALLLLTRDVDYVTDEGKIVLVDERHGTALPRSQLERRAAPNPGGEGESVAHRRAAHRRANHATTLFSHVRHALRHDRHRNGKPLGILENIRIARCEGSAPASAAPAGPAAKVLRRCRQQMASRGRGHQADARDGTARANRFPHHRKQRSPCQATGGRRRSVSTPQRQADRRRSRRGVARDTAAR